MSEELGKRVLGLGAMAALAGALATGLAAAPSPKPVAGVIIDVKGSPTIKSAADGKTLKLKLQQFVYEGDLLKTGVGERAAMAFVGGAEMRINESSEFQVESGGGAKPTSVFTKTGQAWTRLLHGKSGMNLRSPLAVAAVRGTEADVDVDDRMSVKVYEGLVDVQNQYGSQSLQAGMMTEVAGAGQAPQAPKAMNPGDYGSWQNQLDPKDIAGQLKRLANEADKSRSINLKFKGKDGSEKSLDIKLKKK